VTLHTDGFVKIYVDGDINIANNAVFCGNVLAADCYVQNNPTLYRPDSDPDEILLYGYGESRDAACVQQDTFSTVTLDNKSHFYGKIYAPESETTVIQNGAHVYGAVVASGMSLESWGGLENLAEVHYDAALAETLERSASVKVMNRKECYYGTLITNSPEGIEYYATGSCALRP
jgi:hypothetical protein